MKQVGFLRLVGTNGDVTFYRGRTGGFKAKSKSSLNKDRIKNDPNFVRTRENNAAFTSAANGARLLRSAVSELSAEAKGNNLASRMLKVMSAIVRTDTTSPRASRNVAAGDITLLENFAFNNKAPLDAVLKTLNTATISRTTGTLQLDVPAFVPEKALSIPTGATHYKIVSAGVEINFANHTVVVDQKASAFLPIDSVATAPLTQTNTVSAGSSAPLLLFAGVKFFQEVNGVKYSLKNVANNPLGIIKVSVV